MRNIFLLLKLKLLITFLLPLLLLFILFY